MKFDPSKHPRAKAGSGHGGQFAPLSYDAKANTGTGYGKEHGDDRVRQAQRALNRMHLTDARGNPLVVDGKLGPRTTEAIKAYQRKAGIKPADGKITPALLAKLRAAKAPHSKSRLVAKKTLVRR